VIYLNEEEVKQLLPMKACVDMMRRAFEEMRAGRTRNQPRRRLILDTGSVLHQMAGSYGKYFVAKIYSSNRKYGLLQMINILYDAETGKPLAYLEANNLGLIRTGAASGYATDLLADPKASVVGMIGSGYQARGQVEAMRAVRPIKEIRVWSRKRENAELFAKEFNCVVAESAEAAVRDAPIVQRSGARICMDQARHYDQRHGIERREPPRDAGGSDARRGACGRRRPGTSQDRSWRYHPGR
jgi:ornithine cyclodeaminase/alanine dehydrogenase-like protein (mu-crystallin family)